MVIDKVRAFSTIYEYCRGRDCGECGESLGFIKRFIINQPDSFLAFCEGNVFKYLYRYPKKSGVEDLKKAREYLNRMIEHLEDEK